MIEVFNEKKQNEYKSLVYQAWHVAAFERQEKLPDIDKVLSSFEKQKPKQTDEDLLNMAKTLNALYGGNEVCRE